MEQPVVEVEVDILQTDRADTLETAGDAETLGQWFLVDLRTYMGMMIRSAVDSKHNKNS